MIDLAATLMQAARRLARRPLHTLAILSCLALGIGANTAIFSVVQTLLVRPLPLHEPDRLVFTLTTPPDGGPSEASLLDFVTLRKSASSLQSVGVAMTQGLTLAEGDRPERVSGALVSAGYLPTLGVNPALGRFFTAEEDRPGAAPVILLGDGLWRRRFGGDPKLVGRALRADGRVFTVIGIMPPGFDLPLATEMWMPLAQDVEALPLNDQLVGRYMMVGRLAPGATLASAQEEARGLAQRIAVDHPERRTGWSIRLIPLRQQLIGDLNGRIRPTLLLLLAVVGFLLLLTCANVANLLLVRALERGHEVAVQLAMGAGRAGLVGKLLAESLLLSMGGGLLGILLASAATPPLMALSPVQANALADRFGHTSVDTPVLLFALGVSLVTGVLFGLAPAWATAWEGPALQRLRQGGRRSTGGQGARRALRLLTVGEIAVAVTLLVASGLMVRSFRELASAELGYSTSDRVVLEFELSPSDYPDPARRLAFIEQLLTRVRALPGVASAGTTSGIPLGVSSWDATFAIEGQPDDPANVPITAHRVVTPGLLETLGVRLTAGRLPDQHDTASGERSLVVTRAFAQRAWPGQDALGKRVRARREPDRWFKVIGVIEDTKEDRFNFGIDRPVWYVPLAQRDDGLPFALVLKSQGVDAASLVSPARAALQALDRNQPVTRVYTLDEHVNAFLGPQRFAALVSGVFALLGLVLAAVGIYGVTAFALLQRTAEFGIRMALGAQPRGLVAMVLGQSLRTALIGLAVGTLGAVALGRALSTALFQVRSADPATIAVVALLLLGVTLLATWVPARRVASIDPSLALRYE